LITKHVSAMEQTMPRSASTDAPGALHHRFIARQAYKCRVSLMLIRFFNLFAIFFMQL
jgi:hypothetical protein